MSVIGTTAPSLLGYQLRLPAFEGPFDVLLRLVERSQLVITDVSLVAVTDQFLAHLDVIGNVPPETVAEFANVGTRLVLLKSRSLLPRPPAPDEDTIESDLARDLIEYRAVKLAARQLGDRDARGEGAFARALGATATPAPTAPPRLAAHEVSSLARAIRRRLAIIPSPRAVLAARPLVSLREMVDRVLSNLTERPGTRFSGIARGCNDHHELRTAFLAVLVLMRRRLLEAEQEHPFGEISLRRLPGGWNQGLDEAVSFSADD